MSESAAAEEFGEDVLELLAHGELDVEGRLVDASNATLYCSVTHEGTSSYCVYKPIRGERPLWDFPDGTLAGREVAAYEVSVATGWSLVPPTILRDGPFGPGMCQLWIDVDDSVDVARLVRTGTPALRRMALFDAVINNADRKGGHLLPTADGEIYGVDHGVSFHCEDKLRTVLWGWRERKLSRPEIEVLTALRAGMDGELGERLAPLLTRNELWATETRIDRLLATGVFPSPSDDWPAIPWPPF